MIALIEEFWWEATYVAKNLWRDELIQAKYNLDVVMKLQLLVKLLEWRVEIDHDWSIKPGVLGKGLKRLLDQMTWSELANTYVGPTVEDNWEALFTTTRLFRRVAHEVAQALEYDYLDDLDRGVADYLQAVRTLEQEQKQEMFQAIREIQERNKDADPDEVYCDVTEAVEEVRREQE